MLTLIIYNLILLALSPLLVIYVIVELVIKDRSRRGFRERLGLLPRHKLEGEGPTLWIHAVSVGETAAAQPIRAGLQKALPGWKTIYSTITDTGQQQAVKAIGDKGNVIYFPLDFIPCVWLALRRARPSLIVIVETELWPNYLAVAKLLGCKIMLVNGRISDRSLRGASRIPLIYRWMTGNIDRFCMQSQEDADRIIRLGADPRRVSVMGNSKFDQKIGRVSLGEQVTLRDTLGLQRDEPILVAGSTHPGEEEIVLRAFRQTKTSQPEARLIIAPRDIHRAQEVEELVTAHGFAVTRRSKAGNVPPPPDAVIILDTIGELARAYALSDAAFVGGSFVPVGGHNVLEPLAMGKAAIFGPYMSNFRDIAAIVLEGKIGEQVASAEELAACWLRYLTHDDLRLTVATEARRTLKRHQGASTRCVAEALRLLGNDHAGQRVG